MLTQASKFKRLTDHPMHSRMSKSTKGRLKRSSFIHHSRILERQQPELLYHMPEPIHTAVPCWKDKSSQPSSRTSQVLKEKQRGQTLTEDPLLWSTLVPTNQEGWTQVYTDGSTIETTRDGGGGVYIKL